MISNYNFEKKIKKINNLYNLEIVLPNILNNFNYKIYGNNGFFQNGKFTTYKNINTDNTLVFSIDKIQIIFINIKINNKIEYFDFLDMSKKINNYNLTKNIKINIKRKSNEEIKIDEKLNTDNNSSDEESDSESDTESEISE